MQHHAHANPAHILKLSASPQKAAEEMVKIIDVLTGIYQEETEALKRTDTKSFNALQDKKMDIARRYEQGINQMINRRTEMTAVTAETKDKLRAMQNNFASIALQNKTLLERLKRTTTRLGETIRHAAKDAVQKRSSTGYSADGGVRQPKGRNLSVGVNETA